MADEGLCLRDRIGKAIQEHFPDGLTEQDGVEILEVLADLAGEGLSMGSEAQVQSFVTLVMSERRIHRATRRRPPTTLSLQ